MEERFLTRQSPLQPRYSRGYIKLLEPRLSDLGEPLLVYSISPFQPTNKPLNAFRYLAIHSTGTIFSLPDSEITPSGVILPDIL